MQTDEVKERAEKAGLTCEYRPPRNRRRVRVLVTPAKGYEANKFVVVGKREAMVFLMGYEAGKRAK
jgi:hypothetical protein